MELILAMHNIRSAYNVGAMLRTADGFGVDEVIFSGYTPRINDERALPYLREKIDKQIKKTALGAEEYVKNYGVEDILKELRRLKEKGFLVLGLENNIVTEKPIFKIETSNLSELSSALNKIKKYEEKKLILLIGEEVGGIDEELYKEIDLFLEIPMKGQKESFNVSVATGVALFYLSGLAG